MLHSSTENYRKTALTDPETEQLNLHATSATSQRPVVQDSSSAQISSGKGDFSQYKAAGVCFYALHPSTQLIHVLMIKEEKTKRVLQSHEGSDNPNDDKLDHKRQGLDRVMSHEPDEQGVGGISMKNTGDPGISVKNTMDPGDLIGDHHPGSSVEASSSLHTGSDRSEILHTELKGDSLHTGSDRSEILHTELKGDSLHTGSDRSEILHTELKGDSLHTGSDRSEILHTELKGDESMVGIEYWNFLGGKRDEQGRYGVREQHPAVTAAREVEEESHSLLNRQIVENMICLQGHSHWWQPGRYLLYFCQLDDAWELPVKFEGLVKAGKIHPEATGVKHMVWMPLAQVGYLLARKSPLHHKKELKILTNAIVRSKEAGHRHSLNDKADSGVGLHFCAYHVLKSGAFNRLESLNSKQDMGLQDMRQNVECGHRTVVQRSSAPYELVAQQGRTQSGPQSHPPISADVTANTTSYFNIHTKCDSRETMIWRRRSPPAPLPSHDQVHGDLANECKKSVLKQVISNHVVKEVKDKVVPKATEEQGGINVACLLSNLSVRDKL
ncbi:hypothetical protein CEUSTIGMA_g4209.t1 [Chlamydomonas eustigma]|uniref:Nudix hydrolase domain-containing protein n=1 Tax=Chlamydomonas eustigma TaxID=1157962 RepID=A0A250X1J5_9CHLO|nr:hypothetical protein CEUSTIGMA_g4209.t1 [Chlamydomonas eustigma]|eukprot:GAX76762.1 hypothetical protein CEUSTIGMA_g4209.t1 [Chlamydomonas eustigma]